MAWRGRNAEQMRGRGWGLVCVHLYPNRMGGGRLDPLALEWFGLVVGCQALSRKFGGRIREVTATDLGVSSDFVKGGCDIEVLSVLKEVLLYFG